MTSREDKTVCVRRYYSRLEALAAESALKDAGVPVILQGGDAAGWAPHFEWITGLRLFVREADLDQARKVLDELADEGHDG